MSSIKFAELNFYGWWEYFAFNKVNNEVNNWILLENQFMVGLFFNPHVLTNLCNYCGDVNINCSIGVRYFRYISDLKHYGSIWYDSAGIFNILLFTKVKNNSPYAKMVLYKIIHRHKSQQGVTLVGGSHRTILLQHTTMYSFPNQNFQRNPTLIHSTQTGTAKSGEVVMVNPSSSDMKNIVCVKLLKTAPLRSKILMTMKIYLAAMTIPSKENSVKIKQ